MYYILHLGAGPAHYLRLTRGVFFQTEAVFALFNAIYEVVGSERYNTHDFAAFITSKVNVGCGLRLSVRSTTCNEASQNTVPDGMH